MSEEIIMHLTSLDFWTIWPTLSKSGTNMFLFDHEYVLRFPIPDSNAFLYLAYFNAAPVAIVRA
jgi:hypothetical protein